MFWAEFHLLVIKCEFSASKIKDSNNFKSPGKPEIVIAKLTFNELSVNELETCVSDFLLKYT